MRNGLVTAMDDEKKIFVRMENIYKDFPGVKALEDVSIQFRVGEIHGLVGENGAGKSTLIKILMGVFQKTSGNIFVDDKKIDTMDPITSRRLGLGAVYQDVTIASHLTVAENFFLGKIPKTKLGLVRWNYIYQTVSDVLTKLNINIDPHALVKDLSAAKQEMVVIAKKYFDKSKLIIFDEPTALLANEEVEALFRIICQLKAEGTAIIYISHRLEEIFRICDVVTVLKDGREIATMPVSDTTENDLVTKMVGRTIADMYTIQHFTLGENVLTVKNLTSTGKFKNISFELRKGEILGLFGLVGSGRTEIVRAIFGADAFQAGELSINGRCCEIKNPAQAIRRGLGLLPEDRKTQGLALLTSIKENVNLASYSKYSVAGIINIKKERENAKEYIEKLRIAAPSMNQKVMNLSGGNQQKVVIGKWLCKNSSIFIFDEPTVGIDVGAKSEIYKLFQYLLEAGNTILMISSYLPEIMGIADRIMVIHEGTQAGIVERCNYSEELLLKLASGLN